MGYPFFFRLPWLRDESGCIYYVLILYRSILIRNNLETRSRSGAKPIALIRSAFLKSDRLLETKLNKKNPQRLAEG
ncbi:hypothetical protein BI334_03905 [Moorena producens 3L]|nr:hypothetical protein BI334_03905 [Moorena producens 3L]